MFDGCDRIRVPRRGIAEDDEDRSHRIKADGDGRGLAVGRISGDGLHHAGVGVPQLGDSPAHAEGAIGGGEALIGVGDEVDVGAAVATMDEADSGVVSVLF